MSQRILPLGSHPFPGEEEPPKRPRPTSNLRGDSTTSAVNQVSFIISTSNSQSTPRPPARHYSIAFEGGSPNAVINTGQLTLPLSRSVETPQAQTCFNPAVAEAAFPTPIPPRLTRRFVPNLLGVTVSPPTTIPTPPTLTAKPPQQAEPIRSANPIDLTAADDEEASLLLSLTSAPPTFPPVTADVIPTPLSPPSAPTSPDLLNWAPGANPTPYTLGFSAGNELGPDENGDLLLDPRTSFLVYDELISSAASSSTDGPTTLSVERADGGAYAPTVENLKQNSFLAQHMDGMAPAASSSSVAPLSRRWSDPDAWLKFLAGEGPDDLGRSLAMIRRVEKGGDLRTPGILLFDARFLEGAHNYIQRLFPTPEPSNAEPTAPVLSKKVRNAFFAAKKGLYQENLRLSFRTMLLFYGFTWDDEGNIFKNADETHPHCFSKRKQWLYIGGQHNFLRITRILRSLSLLGLEKEAKQFFEALKGLYTEGHVNYTEECTQEFLPNGQKNREFIPALTRSVWETAIASTQP